MPEPKQTNFPSQPPQSNGTRPPSPLAEPRRSSVLPGEEKVRAALKEGDLKSIEEMGSRAKPALFKIIQDQDEELLSRRFAADAAMSLYGNGMRAYDRLLCLLLQDKVQDAASRGDVAVLQVLGIVNNRKESTLLRNIAIEVVASINHGPESYSTLSVVAALSSLLANEQEVPVIRAKIADELPKLAKVCDPAKMKLMMSALEKAAKSEDSGVVSAAEDALVLIDENSRTCVDDNPTLPVAPRKGVPL